MKFTFGRIGEYLILSKDVYYGGSIKWTVIWSLIYIISVSSFVYLGNEYVNINELIKSSSQELINAFTLISGFMLTGISIMLATGKVEDIKKLKDNYNTDEKGVILIINKLKKILFYEILFQFVIIILINLFIAGIKGLNITNLLVIDTFLVLIFISLIMTYRLVCNFMTFENIIGFKI